MNGAAGTRGKAEFPPLRDTLLKTYLYGLKFMIAVAVGWIFHTDSSYAGSLKDPALFLGFTLLLVVAAAVVGGVSSAVFVGIFVSIAYFLITRWGPTRWWRRIIALAVTAFGGVVAWAVFSIGGSGEPMGDSLALISLISAPIYGIVLSEVVLRKSNA